ncbi:S-adenosyl-L-methionine-dependent methyltransferase [Lophiotrema nucula]|uniref:S-adenosyl-L-methionine-dependent methyltransferase n=1 Tax=Lophiotrema nucula TaxID=690887 RepID=A0A6A5YGS6_9PLEO|nr:S-adenosyl-L-methionine-dependent methyltransferase [Lophiotrema nucula]
MAENEQKKNDWSATQYLKFNTQRTRPVYDLVSQILPHIPLSSSTSIFDLGCGPGNSTKVLLDAFPTAKITGIDSSPDMLSKARSTLPSLAFRLGDVESWTLPSRAVDILFSNAVFHWLRSPSRIRVIAKLLGSLASGGVLAFQVPDNYHQPSHALMRSTATSPSQPWSPYFQNTNTRVGDIQDKKRPDLDPIEAPTEYYDALAPLSSSVNIWRTEYQHVLPDAGGIVEWVKGTGLQPYLHQITDEEAKEDFLAEYERRLSEVYKPLGDGRVMLGYPRLFVVAVRK